MTFQRATVIAANRVAALPVAASWQSPDGVVVTIRPTRPDDASIVQDFVRELSPEARYFRFMGAVRELTPQMLRRFVRIDQTCEVALAAVATRGGRTRQLGECRYAVCPGGDCEFAVAVLDAWQGRGLGQRLMSNLIAIARIRGLTAMVGDVIATNAAMLGLALKLGFKVGASDEGWSIRRISLALPPPTPCTTGERPPSIPE
jgi:acetyltransferase